MVTCRGPTFAGRVAASLLSAIGLRELVAQRYPRARSTDSFDELLSDPGLEEALSDRLSFRRFVGLSFDERLIPLDTPEFARDIVSVVTLMGKTIG